MNLRFACMLNCIPSRLAPRPNLSTYLDGCTANARHADRTRQHPRTPATGLCAPPTDAPSPARRLARASTPPRSPPSIATDQTITRTLQLLISLQPSRILRSGTVLQRPLGASRSTIRWPTALDTCSCPKRELVTTSRQVCDRQHTRLTPPFRLLHALPHR